MNDHQLGGGIKANLHRSQGQKWQQCWQKRSTNSIRHSRLALRQTRRYPVRQMGRHIKTQTPPRTTNHKATTTTPRSLANETSAIGQRRVATLAGSAKRNAMSVSQFAAIASEVTSPVKDTARRPPMGRRPQARAICVYNPRPSRLHRVRMDTITARAMSQAFHTLIGAACLLLSLHIRILVAITAILMRLIKGIRLLHGTRGIVLAGRPIPGRSISQRLRILEIASLRQTTHTRLKTTTRQLILLSRHHTSTARRRSQTPSHHTDAWSSTIDPQTGPRR